MAACPNCGAVYDPNQPELERCQTCGNFLPRAGTVQPAPSEAAKSKPASGTDVLPAATVPATTDRPAEQFIRPRNLSPEYAQRVTEHWAGTHPAGVHPQETIHSDAGTSEEEENLVIGMRNVVHVEDGKRGDYELTEVIGKGGMGEVWSAHQASLNRQVALKYPKSTHGGSRRDKFIFEVVVTGQLDHPNIVPIYDFARDTDGRLFYAMKRVDGRPWNTCIHDGSLSLQQNIEILMKVCDGLRFAHDRGVIHCDIKPHNIMVGRYGEVSVMDFGAAVRLDGGAAGTGSAKASPGGTLAYMPPEIASLSRGQICPATDVYLLGAVLYEILSGEPPHPPPQDSKDPHQRISDAAKIAARNEIKALTSGGELADIAYKAMATDIAKRYQTVGDFQDAIRNYLAHAESIALAERGQEHLRQATDDGHGAPTSPGARFDEFDRARFAFEESVKLWPQNKAAQTGLQHAIIAYANYAYREGAYARGMSLLDPNNKEHAPLLKKLTSARKNTNRLWTLLRTAAAIIVIGGAAGAASLWIQNGWLAEQTELAKGNEEKAKKSAHEAEEREKEAERLRGVAVAEAEAKEIARQEAAKNALLAEQRREIAAVKQRLAEAAERRAQESAYASAIGVADKALQRNAFDRVLGILTEQQAIEEKLAQPLRFWEWGYLNSVATDRPAELFTSTSGAPQRFESAAISPDGNWIVAGSVDGPTYIWSRANPQNRLPLEDEPFTFKSVRAVAIAERGNEYLVAVAGEARDADAPYAARIWRIEASGQRELLPTVFPHTKPLLSVAFSKDSSELLTSAEDGNAILWDVSTARPQQTFPADLRGRSVWSARFSPDEKWIVTAADDGSVRIWDRQGQEWDRFADHDGPAFTAQFLPNSDYVVSGGGDGRVLAHRFDRANSKQWRLDQTQLIKQDLAHDTSAGRARNALVIGEHAAPVNSVAVSAEGKLVFSAGNDNTVRVWNVEAGVAHPVCEKVLRGHGGWVRACAAVGSDHVLSAAYDNRVLLWNWPNYRSARVLAHDSPERLTPLRLSAAAVAPHADWIATASDSGVVTVWDMAEWDNPQPRELSEGHVFQATTGILFADDRRLLTAGGDNTALLWDVDSGSELARIGSWYRSGTGWRGVAAVSPDGRLVATGNNPAEEAHAARLGVSAGPADPFPLAQVWDIVAGRKITDIVLHQQFAAAGVDRPEATALAFTADGRSLLVADQLGTCRLFDAATGTLQKSFVAHDGKIAALKFLPDGRFLLTAGTDRAVKKWDLSADTLRPVLRFDHGDQVVALDCSADGAMIITASGPRDKRAVLRVWNATSASPVASLSLDAVLKQLRLPPDPDVEPAAPGGRQQVRSVIRSVAFHPTEPVALVAVYSPFEPDKSRRSRVGQWRWADRAAGLRPLFPEPDVAMATYAKTTGDRVLTVGRRGARLLAQRADQPGLLSQVMTFRPQPAIRAISFSPDRPNQPHERRLASAAADGSIKIWVLDVNRQWKSGTTLPATGSSLRSIAFHPVDPDLLLTAGTDGVALRKRAGDAWNIERRFEVPGQNGTAMQQAIFSPDGGSIIAIAHDGRLYVWITSTGALSLSHKFESGATSADLQCVDVSPSGHWLAVGSQRNLIFLNVGETVRGDRQRGPYPAHAADITALCFSPNGKRLFTSAKDFTAKVWDVSSLADPPNTEAADEQAPRIQELLTLTEHQGFVTSVVHSPVDKNPFLLTTGLDGQAILWPCKMAIDDRTSPE